MIIAAFEVMTLCWDENVSIFIILLLYTVSRKKVDP